MDPHDTHRVFEALAHPVRLAIVQRLRRSPASVAVLAEAFPVSRPAVSQHLKVLKDAGLVTGVADGAKRIYQIDPSGFAALREWLDPYWDEALAGFRAEVLRRKRKGHRT